MFNISALGIVLTVHLMQHGKREEQEETAFLPFSKPYTHHMISGGNPGHGNDSTTMCRLRAEVDSTHKDGCRPYEEGSWMISYKHHN